MVRTRENISRRGSHDARQSSAHGAWRRPTTSAHKRGQNEADVVEDDVVEHQGFNVAQTRSRGLATMVQDFQMVPLIHLYWLSIRIMLHVSYGRVRLVRNFY